MAYVHNQYKNKYSLCVNDELCPSDGRTNLYCGQDGVLKLSVCLPHHLSLGHVKPHCCHRPLKDGSHPVDSAW